MIREIILDQKEKRAKKLLEPYVLRDKAEIIAKMSENDLIKVIIGPRRAGKSVVALHAFKPNDAAYLNFDDEKITSVSDYNFILRELLAVYGPTKNLLFDEIQNLPRWELFANRLHRNGYNLLLTGSNSKLLSKELATHLTGRHLPIELMPFNFKEFLAAKQFSPEAGSLAVPEHKAELLRLVSTYMEQGGFPEIVIKNIDPVYYLESLLESLLFRDVIKRYKIRFSNKLYELEQYLIDTAGNQFSYERLCHKLGFNSWTTAMNYFGYLEEAYLVMALGRYTTKSGERLRSPKKAFVVDTGYITAKAVLSSPNKGAVMENSVFTELVKQGLRPGLELFYYQTRNQKEVDFLIRQNLRVTTLMQVAYDISNSDVLARETNALAEASAEVECDNLIILNWDREETLAVKGKKIQLIPLWRWLLGG